ncbi:MAG TPA: hypothetical protein VL988_06085 [Solirubrobacteraceae bacterium]|nr:hypothetical protein [Solirubrobacteraceae bacterium]
MPHDQGFRPSIGSSLLVALIVLAVTACFAAAADALPSQFGEQGSGAGELFEPHGIAVSKSTGEVFIANRNNQRVDRFSGEGDFERAWGEGVADGVTQAPQTCTLICFEGLEGAGAGEFVFPEGVALDEVSSEPGVYVGDQRQNHRVQKFSPDGAFILMFGGGVNKTKVETPGATEAEKNLCTAASGNVCQGGTLGTGNGQFGQTVGAVAVDSAGTVYVADVNRVEKFSPGGAYIGQLSLPGAGAVEQVAVDATKDVYVKSSDIAGVRKFDEAGVELGSPRDASGTPSSLAVGPSGELFVGDGLVLLTAHHILEYSPTGTQLASFDSDTPEGATRGLAYGESAGVLYKPEVGSVRLLVPPSPGPLVISQSSEAIGTTSATLGAVVNPEGPEATSVHFEYGVAGFEKSTASKALGGGPFQDQPVSAQIAALKPSTTYRFRAVATNALGQTTDGPEATFTTLPAVSIDGEPVTRLNQTSVRLGAELNPHGLPTEYHFEYGTSTSYGEVVPVPDASAGSGTTDTTVGIEVQGLSPGTTYHFRVVAHNSLGTVQGEDRTFTTQGEPATVLPDGRAWEMVSPSNKQGVSLEAITEEGGVIQAAEDGSAMTYIAKAAIEPESPSNLSIADTQVLSNRGATGWQSRDITTPHEAVVVIRPGHLSEYRQFSGDLSLGAVEPQGATPLSPQTTERTPYVRQANGEYTPLATAANVAPGVKFGGIEAEEGGRFSEGVQYVGTSPNLQHIVLASSKNLTPGFEGAGMRNLFEWSGGVLTPVSILPNGQSVGEAGFEAGLGNTELNVRSAVSANGQRVVFESTAPAHPIYMRDLASGKTIQLNAPQGGGGNNTIRPQYQIASADMSKVFFTSDVRLTADATAKPRKPDLYMCTITSGPSGPACALHDLTIDSNPGQAGDVQATIEGARGDIAAVSEDGRYVYFAANGQLAPGAVPGDCEEETEAANCNFYVRDTVTEQTRLVTVLSGADWPDWAKSGKLGMLTTRTSPSGRYLAFMSERPLTGYDNRDAVSGQRDEEVFLFDSQRAFAGQGDTIHCASCNPTGARPHGIFDRETFPGLLVDRPRVWGNRWIASTIPGFTQYSVDQTNYQSRYLSDSGRMFFNSSDALVPQDANGKEDVYEYEPEGVGSCALATGCASLISSGGSSEESAFLDASASGDDVFFLTTAQLVASDIEPDDFDVYDAHVCTSESPCPPQATTAPPPCATTDSCRAASPPQPLIFGPPPSATFNGAGNAPPPAAATKPASKPASKPTRAQQLAKALSACRKKHNRAKRVSCEKQARKRYGPVKKGAKKSSRHKARGAGR